VITRISYDTVIFEAAFALEKTYRVPRPVIRAGLQPILELPGVVLPGKRLYVAVFDLSCASLLCRSLTATTSAWLASSNFPSSSP
jgi:hypothetical protein